MIISTNTPEVKALSDEFQKQKKVPRKNNRNRALSHVFGQALMREIIEPEVMRHPGELILAYKEFLSLKPTGAHSFAYGSEMRSVDIQWVIAGRIVRENLRLQTTRPRSWRMRVAEGLSSMRFYKGADYFVPVYWRQRLDRRYRNPGNFYVLHDDNEDRVKVPEEDKRRLDLSWMGDFLFKFETGEWDWYTKISLVIGTNAVRRWLEERHSGEAYIALRKRDTE